MKPCQRGVLGRGREVSAEGDRGETPTLTGVHSFDGRTGGASSFVSAAWRQILLGFSRGEVCRREGVL
jgi:hypothetical protein